MNPSAWSRVSELLGEALDLGAEERCRFLSSECSDEGVRLEVERLLAEHEFAGDFLERPLRFGESQREEDLWTGQVLLGRYHIERFVARGGSGAVYFARDRQLAGKPVIVKFLHSWAREYASLRARFRQEMEALARIDHHGVVGVLDTGETADGLPFLVMEYVDGVTLRSEMRGGAMDIRRVARIIRGIGSAAGAAHAKGVLHRDLKPENIMLERPGTGDEIVRLIDFGIARVEDPGREAVTQLTQFAGTTPYMAPEQLLGRPCAASDTYAIGVIAFEMLTGRRPYLVTSPVELYEQQRAGAKMDPQNLRAEIPDAAARSILQQLSFHAKDRGASAIDAANTIATALLGPRREIWSRRRAATVVTAGSLLAAAGGYGWWSNWGRSLGPTEKIVEFPPGAEPLDYGFVKDLSIDYHSLPNADATGWDCVRVTTNDQGAYWRRLTAAQSRAAVREGWKLTIEAAVEEGCLSGCLDNWSAPSRYIINLLRNPDGSDTARLVTGVRPLLKGLDYVLPGPGGARHKFVVAAGTRTGLASLWVDGVKRLTGYPGTTDYHYGWGLGFGGFRYRSQRATGVFWTVRLEIG